MLKKASILLTILITADQSLMAVDNATWTGADAGIDNTWNNNANWDTNVAPVNPGDTANFDEAVTNTTVGGTIVSITTVNFDTTTSYTINTNGISFVAFNGTLPTLNVLQGSHSFTAGAFITDNTTANLSSGATLTLAPTGIFTITNILTITGPGNLLVEGTINGSTLDINNGNITNTGTIDPGRINMTGGTVTNNSTMEAISNIAGAFTISGGHLINNGIIGQNLAIDGGIVSNNNGTISIFPNGSVPSLTITSPGILEGTMTISPTSAGSFTVSNSGIVAAGSATSVSPGTITISPNGLYQQNANGTLVIDVVNGGLFSVLNTFNASLNGTLLVNVPPDFTIPSFPITILNASNSLTGRFSNAISEGFRPNTPFILDPIPIYLSNSVELLFTITTVPPATNYIGGLRETIFSSVNHINIHIGREMEHLRERFAILRCNKYGYLASLPKESLIASNNEELAYYNHHEEELREYIEEDAYPWNVYIGPISSFGAVRPHHFENFPTLAPFGYWSAGFLTGFDYAFTQVGIGLLGSFEEFKGMVDKSWGKFHIEEVHGSFYFTYVPEQLPGFALNGIFGGGYEWYKIERNATLGTGTGIGRPRGWEADGLLGIEYAFTRRNIYCICDTYQFIPMAQLQYIYLNIDHYTESGLGNLDLSVSKQHPESLRTLLGARFVFQYDWCGSFLTSCHLELDGAWQHEYLDHHRNVTINWTSFPTIAPSVLDTVRAGRNLGLFGADLLLTFCERYGLEASYDFEANKLFHDHFFYLGFNARF